MKKIVLIDGHSILNRAFYGVPDLTNADGLHTNAVYGFLNIMFKILDEEQADYLVVVFDSKWPTFRHEIYKEYKGTRKGMPDELREQVPVIKEVLAAMGVKTMEQQGLEADDILGTIARIAEKEGMQVSLISGDRDLLQIATNQIKIRIPKTKGGKTEIEDYYAEDVQNAYQVTPKQFIELKALMGDASDNIPGVPKVGAKTATDLMVQFGSLDDIYENLDQVSKKSVRESLQTNEDLARLSKVLATIKDDCDLGFTFEGAETGGYYTEDAYKLFQQLNFKHMLGRFDVSPVPHTQSSHFQVVLEREQAEVIFAKARQAAQKQYVGVEVLEDGKCEEAFVGIALSFGEEDSYFFITKGSMDKAYLVQQLAALARHEGKLSTFDIKKKYSYLETEQTGQLFDVILAAYLMNPLKNDYMPEDVANEYLGMMIPSKKELFGKMCLTQAAEEKPEAIKEYACFLAYVAFKAAAVLEEKLKEAGMEGLMRDIEMPLSYVLYDMEQLGIMVRQDELKAYGEALNGRISELEKEIHEAAGTDFNINSPKQLGEVLFETLMLPGGKKTKSGYSTAADVLDKLAPDYKVVADVLEYRGLTKLKSTYADGLFACIREDKRIHSSFNQTITATGRISSTEPNLQNIPMRMELGRRIRKVFVPKEGHLFIDADYSQIELRVLAHMSGDEQLIEAYRMEEDIHKITASKVFHTPFEEVTDLQRRNAKAVNFGIVYGISSFGLSQDLSITKKEAADYIDQYFATYPKVRQFMDALVAEAKEKGYVTTLFGRRRPIPELSSSNFMQRSFGERVAMNSPIQGTAADIIKIAMINVWNRLREEKFKSRLLLQVHDELLVETKEEEADLVMKIVLEEMRGAASLDVKLEVDAHTGTNWYEAK